MKISKSLLILYLSIILTAQICMAPQKYQSESYTPGPVTLDSLKITSVDDKNPCIKAFYSDTNSMKVWYNIYRSIANDTIFNKVTGGQNIPNTYSSFCDKNIFNEINLGDNYAEFFYRLNAISKWDSVSSFSNIKSVKLISPPIMDSISLKDGYPTISYTIYGGQRGVTWSIEITDADTSISKRENLIDRFGTIKETVRFVNLSLDSLKEIAQSDSLNDGIYGVRIISSVKNAKGIAVDYFDVMNR